METLFLFGSGASSSPKVGEITEAVLNTGNDFSMGSWDSCPEALRDNPAYSEEVRWLVSYVAELIAAELEKEAVNYEHIAHVLRTLMTAKPSKLAAMMLVRKVGDALDINFPDRKTHRTADVAYHAMERLKWIVYRELREARDEALDKFVANILLPSSDRQRIVTLNHDRHIEMALSNAGVSEVNSGFWIKRAGELPSFSPDRLAENSCSKLLKLHGSIDWFSAGAYDFIQTLDSELQNDAPALLSGTDDKLEQYAYRMFPWLWAEFQTQLRAVRQVVVVGYGFRDEGVNVRLASWLGYKPGARLMIVDAKPEDALGRFRHPNLVDVELVAGTLQEIVCDAEKSARILCFCGRG